MWWLIYPKYSARANIVKEDQKASEGCSNQGLPYLSFHHYIGPDEETFEHKIVIIFTLVFWAAQKNSLIERVLMSTHNRCFVEK